MSTVPCSIKLLKISAGSVDFYDFDEYERLVESARRIGSTTHVVILLGGDAGLRAGEMRGLRWTDVDLPKGSYGSSAMSGRGTSPARHQSLISGGAWTSLGSWQRRC